MDFSKESLSPSVLTVLPDDVIMEIITRLPVKSLLRFKCVSKAFLALVDSPYFIKKHHNHAVKLKTNHKIIVNSHYYSYHSIDIDLLDQALELEHPLKFYMFDGTILGSVHGLLCIQITAEDIIIWNPATTKYQKLSAALDHKYSTTHGFGYDPVSDDYKIISINQFGDRDNLSIQRQTAVYSSRSNSWQFLQDFPYHIRNFKDIGCGTLISGELLWCVKQSDLGRSPFLIVAFNLATNNFSLVAHPDALNDEFNMTSDKFFKITIGEVGGCLCVTRNTSTHTDVWVMRNYRVKESWTKLFSISKQELETSFLSPLAYSKKGDEIMLLDEYNKLFRYNLKENVPRSIKVRDSPNSGIQTVICVESLAHPNGRWREK